MSPPPAFPDLDALLVHASWARDLARGLVTDTAAADDLVQDAWVAALENPPRHAENLRGWLGAVIGNLARSRGRSQGRRAAREAQVGLDARQEAPSSADLASQVDTQRRLASAVLELEEPYRSAVILRFYEGLNATRIADRLGIAPGTARWRIKTGLDSLRGRLDRDFGGDRAAWVALVLPIARPRLAPPSAEAAAATAKATATASSAATLKGLLSVKLTSKTVALWAVALFGITGITLVVDPSSGGRDRLESVPAAVTFSPLEESISQAADLAPVDVPGRAAASTPVESAAAEAPVVAPAETVASMRLVDPDGRPVLGASVRSLESSSADDGVTSDASGLASLSLAGLEERSSVFIRIDHPHFAELDLRNVVEPGRVTEFGDVVLQPAGAVEGRVLLADGQPASGAWVDAALSSIERELEESAYGMARRKRSERSSQAIADEHGNFRIERVPAGIVRLWGGLDGHLASLSAPVEVRQGTLSSGLEIRLGALDPEDFITGEVRLPDGAPAPRASIRVAFTRALHGSGSSSFSADADGRFRIAAFPGAVYHLDALDRHAAHGSAEESSLVAGDHVVLQLGHKRTIELFLTHDGLPFTEAEVMAVRPASGRYAVAPFVVEVVDDHHLIPVPRGEFTLQARADGFELLELGPFDEDTAPSTLNAELVEIAGLRGRVLIDGLPVAGARVSASPVARQTVEANGFPSLVEPYGQVEGTTDDAGNFALTLREARAWIVRAEMRGHAPSELGPLEFDPADGIEGIELSLTPGGSIEGRVLESGRAVAGRIVAASRGDGHPISTRTDVNGIYRFEHLMAGRWQVQKTDEDLVPGNHTATMWGEAITEADLPWNCMVSEGRTTIHNIESGPRPTLVGRLTFDGRGPGAWSARLQDDADPVVRDHTARLAADGSFTIEMPSEGRYRLMITADGEECMLTAELDLFGSRVDWSLDLPAGAIEISGIPGADGSSGAGTPPEILFALARAGDLVVVAPIPPGVSSVHTLDPIPAGDYVVRAGNPRNLSGPDALFDFGRKLTEFRVEQGGRSEVVLPDQDQ